MSRPATSTSSCGSSRSLSDQPGLIHDLEQLLGVDVDVISEGALPSANKSLLSDAIDLLDEPASHPHAQRDRDQRLDDLTDICEHAGLCADDVTRTRLRR